MSDSWRETKNNTNLKAMAAVQLLGLLMPIDQQVCEGVPITGKAVAA